MIITDKSVLDWLSKVTKISSEDILSNLTKKGEKEGETVIVENDKAIAYLDKIIKDKINVVGSTNLGRGKSEALTNFEKEIRTNYSSSDTSLKGIDLVKSIVDIEIEKVKKPEKVIEKEITIETAKASPIVQKLLKDAVDVVVKEKDTISDEYSNYKKQITGKAKKDLIWNSFEATARKNKHLLAAAGTPQLANQKNFFLNGLNLDNYKIDETDPQNKRIVILDDAGNPLKNDYQDLVDTEKHFLKISPFPVVKYDPDKGGSGAGGEGGKGGSGSTKRFKNEEEMTAYITNMDIPEADREKAFDEWEKSKKDV